MLICITSLSILAASQQAVAQTVVFNADFSNTVGDNAWTSTINTNGSYGTASTYIFSSGWPGVSNNANYAIESPVINLSLYENLTLDLDHYYRTQAGRDGMQVQYRIGGGAWIVLGTAASGYYNDTDVDAIANGADGWSGTNYTPSDAFTSAPTLNLSTFNPAFDGAPSVQFRIFFESDGSVESRGTAVDNFIIRGTISNPYAGIELRGAGQTINNGDITPATIDDTDFGTQLTGASRNKTYTILNNGTTALTLTGGSPHISISGTDAGFFSVTQLPNPTISSGGSTTFDITYSGTTPGVHKAAVNITSSDATNNPYSFGIVGTTENPSYCDSFGFQGGTNDDPITRVRFNTIDQSSSSTDNDYSDYTAVSTTIERGAAYTITVDGAIEFNRTYNQRVWIDWNHDYDFADAGEQFEIGSFSNSTGSQIIGSSSTTITVPAGAAIGTTRMRVSHYRNNTAAGSCATNFSGETEDYTVNIIASGPQPEIAMNGMGNIIIDGAPAAIASNGTDFGTLLNNTSKTNTFNISNSGNADLQLTGASPYVTITGSPYFTLTSTPAGTIPSGGGDTSFSISYDPTVAGIHTAIVSIANNDASEDPYDFVIKGASSNTLTPEISVEGEAISILDNDTVASLIDGTDFGNVFIGSSKAHDFDIINIGSDVLNLTGSPAITITGANAGQFGISQAPISSLSSGGGSTTFQVWYVPTTAGVHNATIKITSDDADENPYTFAVRGFSVMDIRPNYTIYHENFDSDDGGWTASTTGSTSWTHGTNSEPGTQGSFWHTNPYENYTGNSTTYATSPTLDLRGYQDLKLYIDIRYNMDNDLEDGMNMEYSDDNGATWSTLGVYNATPVGEWYNDTDIASLGAGSDGWSGLNEEGAGDGRSNFVQASINLPLTLVDNPSVRLRVKFASNSTINDAGANFDNVYIVGNPQTPFALPSTGPANVVNNLKLWLKADANTSTIADGTLISSWNDNAYDNDASGTNSKRPTYYNNGTENINHNPVVDFNSIDQTELEAKGGYYTEDYWIVMRADNNINSLSPLQGIIAGRNADTGLAEDGTGLWINPGSLRFQFNDNIVSHMVGVTPGQLSGITAGSYGRAFESSTESYDDEVIIFNVKTNAAGDMSEIYKNGIRIDNLNGTASETPYDLLPFFDVDNSTFTLGSGRISLMGHPYDSHYDGKITEVISFSEPNSRLSQRKIQSYLALKNGVTLHATNSTLATRLGDEDYLDSAGNIIWDSSVNAGYTYDIAGIGTDVDAGL